MKVFARNSLANPNPSKTDENTRLSWTGVFIGIGRVRCFRGCFVAVRLY